MTLWRFAFQRWTSKTIVWQHCGWQWTLYQPIRTEQIVHFKDGQAKPVDFSIKSAQVTCTCLHKICSVGVLCVDFVEIRISKKDKQNHCLASLWVTVNSIIQSKKSPVVVHLSSLNLFQAKTIAIFLKIDDSGLPACNITLVIS